jgi:hypothetical protein
VALEVEQRLATGISDLGELEVSERVPARDEAGKLVERAGNVDRNAFVPVTINPVLPYSARSSLPRSTVDTRLSEDFACRAHTCGVSCLTGCHIGQLCGVLRPNPLRRRRQRDRQDRGGRDRQRIHR